MRYVNVVVPLWFRVGAVSGSIKGVSALGTQCALNAHSIHIDRVRTRNVKV